MDKRVLAPYLVMFLVAGLPVMALPVLVGAEGYGIYNSNNYNNNTYRNDFNNNKYSNNSSNNRNLYQSAAPGDYSSYQNQAPQGYNSGYSAQGHPTQAAYPIQAPQGYNGFQGYTGNAQSNPYANPQLQSNIGYGPTAAYNPGVVTVMSRQLGSHVVLGGTVIPYREVTLTAQMPGRVQFIAGEEGDRFDINQVLVAVDDDDLLAKRRQSVAELGGVSSALRDSRVQYSREFWSPQILQRQRQQQPQPQQMPASGGMGNGLFPAMFERFFGGGQQQGGGGYGGYPYPGYNPSYNPYNNPWAGGNPWIGTVPAVSNNPWLNGNPWIERQADLYTRGTDIKQANSQVMALQSKIDEVDAKLLDTRSISPFEGVILKKLVEVGDTVQPGQPLLHYADTTDLQIRLEVPARLMPGLHKEMILPANLDVGDQRVNARVAQIFPLADAKRHTVTVKLDLPKGVPGGPGMYAEVSIPDVSSPVSVVPVIPTSSIVWRGSLPAVFVVNHENNTELRLLRLGEQLDEQVVAVLSGLRAGERIYISPPPGLNSNWSPKPGAVR